MRSLSLSTRSAVEFVDITAEVRNMAARENLSEGACLVFVPHTTAGVTINESADPAVRRDIPWELNKIVPYSDGYLHGEGNSAAHIKASLVGSSVLVPIAGGDLALGTWQGVFFCEFDGPRKRTVHVQVLKA